MSDPALNLLAPREDGGGRLGRDDAARVIEVMQGWRSRVGAAGQAEIAQLLEELAAWEATRAPQVARGLTGRFARAEQETKRIVCFDGLPGAGKTTHLTRLAQAIGAKALSMVRFAEACGVSQDERRAHQLSTGTLHRTDVALLEALVREPARFVFLEKFPRTPVEAVALVGWARREGWRLDAVHLAFPEDPIGCSVARQVARGAHHGKEITPERALRRAMTGWTRGTTGRWALRDLGVPLHRLDSTRPEAENDEALRRALGLDVASVGFDLETLRALDAVARSVGIEAWVSAGGLYRPFWGGVFGPVQRPTDVDVAVDRPEQVRPLWEALSRAEPSRRWSVACPGARLLAQRGIAAPTVGEAKRHPTLLHRAGAVRWRDGAVELTLAPGAEAALRNGIVAFNQVALERMAPAHRARCVERAAEKLWRVLGDYPGLRLEPATGAELGERFAALAPRPVMTEWRTLKREALRTHLGERALRCRRGLDAEERAVAREILRFHRTSDRRPVAPPLPPRARLPEPLERLRAAREKRAHGGALTTDECECLEQARVAPPDGEASWLSHLAREAEDAVFREWFLDQVHHHLPVGGADGWLRGVLDGSVFGLKAEACTDAQSPMHQGWGLSRHLAASVLALETDALCRSIPSGAPLSLENLRLSMRLAMLFHDVGKRVRTPAQRHGRIGARLWRKHRPGWCPEALVPLVGWMVEAHDLFGALGRGLTDKRGGPALEEEDLARPSAYPAALDVQAARARLADSGLPLSLAAGIAKALWRADVGSIAALRWLLPVAEPLEQLLLCNPGR